MEATEGHVVYWSQLVRTIKSYRERRIDDSDLRAIAREIRTANITMIAYLLLRVIQHKSRSKLAFSNLVTLTRLTISTYIDIVLLLNDPKRAWKELQRLRQLMEEQQKYRQLELQFSS